MGISLERHVCGEYVAPRQSERRQGVGVMCFTWACQGHVNIHGLSGRDEGDARKAFVVADHSQVEVVDPDGAPVHKEPGLVDNEHALERLEWKQADGIVRCEASNGERVSVAAVALQNTGGLMLWDRGADRNS